MQRFLESAAAASLAIVAGCAGGISDQVIVRNDADPYNLAAAQVVADQQCAARGGARAQFVMVLNNPRSPGGGRSGGGGTPDVIYRCVPR
jgi:hypothetical protein